MLTKLTSQSQVTAGQETKGQLRTAKRRGARKPKHKTRLACITKSVQSQRITEEEEIQSIQSKHITKDPLSNQSESMFHLVKSVVPSLRRKTSGHVRFHTETTPTTDQRRGNATVRSFCLRSPRRDKLTNVLLVDLKSFFLSLLGLRAEFTDDDSDWLTEVENRDVSLILFDVINQTINNSINNNNDGVLLWLIYSQPETFRELNPTDSRGGSWWRSKVVLVRTAEGVWLFMEDRRTESDGSFCSSPTNKEAERRASELYRQRVVSVTCLSQHEIKRYIYYIYIKFIY